MMRLHTYGALSLLATLAVIYHAFSSRGQFYLAMVYLSTSKIALSLLLNMGLVIMCVLWQLTKKVFLGPLREAEIERLNEQSWREVMEILFAITIFRQDFSVTFLAMITALLFIKALHWLVQKRVEYIETTPTVPTLSHVRVVSFLGFLLLLDSLFLYSSVKYLIETRQASVSIFFAFEYTILATTTVSTFVKYVFYVTDLLMEGQWEKKPVYSFYLELIRDLLHLFLYLCFFLAIFMNYGVPLHLIRELYETFRNFRIRIADYIRYRKIASNMNDRFPDATPEELNASDATCIICREEMTTAKKLICGHLFHVHCLRSWLERQNTCPTCRAQVVPPENGATTSGWHQGSQPEARRQGTTSSGTENSDGGMANGNLSRHQIRLQAAAAAASLYGKSFVYPSPNTLEWSPGYAFIPQGDQPLPDAANMDSTGEETSTRKMHPQFAMHARNPSSSLPQSFYIPFQAPGANVNFEGSLGGISNTELEAHKKFLHHQIEVLQSQLQLLQKQTAEKCSDTNHASSSDSKSKAFASSSSAPISGHHEDKDS